MVNHVKFLLVTISTLWYLPGMESAFACTLKRASTEACWRWPCRKSFDRIWHPCLFRWKPWGSDSFSVFRKTLKWCGEGILSFFQRFATNLAILIQFFQTDFSMAEIPAQDVVNFDFMEPPDRVRLVKSLRLLFLIGALDVDGKLTALGEARLG